MGWFDDNMATFTGSVGKTPSVLPPPQPGPGDRVQMFTDRQPVLQPSQGGGQDYEAQFRALFPGGTLTPEALAAKEGDLKAMGIRLLGPNARGQRTKIEVPGVGIVDVIGGAGAGHNRLQWMVDRGGPQTGAPMSAMGAPNYGARSGALAQTPGYQFVRDEVLGALERSAAARGTNLTGGLLKDLQDRAAGLASTEFGNEFGRNLSLAQLGFNGATNQGAYGSAYGNQITDLTTGAGNAQAAGTVGAGNAWGSALGNIGQMGMDAWGLYHYGPPGGYGGTPPMFGGGRSGGAGAPGGYGWG